MIPRRTLTLALASAIAILAMPATASAHTPPPFDKRWDVTDTPVSTYRFHDNVPAWARTLANEVLTERWSDPITNNSNSITFKHNQENGKALIHFDNTATPSCREQEPNWLGCAAGAGQGLYWDIYIRRDPFTPWCQRHDVVGCVDFKRVLIHEVAHIGGYLDHHPTSTAANDTIMTDAPPYKPASGQNGYRIDHLQPCDEAAMQIMYGPRDTEGGYPDCFDHVGPGGTGLVSVIRNDLPADRSACSGQSIVVKGRLSILDHDAYGALGKRAIAGRTLYIDRRPVGGTWTKGYRTVVTVPAWQPDPNWTVSLSATSSVPVTYEFRARYEGEPNGSIDRKDGSVFSLTWGPGC